MLLELMLSIIGILFTIFIVVGVHEGAHFIAARLLGIKVLRCSIGFGKALYTWHDKKGTEYVLAPIPLGGYVKLLDESEGPVKESEKHLAFNRQSVYKRFTVVAAGPFSNLVMAFFMYWIIFMMGFQTAIPIIGSVSPHSIASHAGLQDMQEIVSIDGHPTQTWSAVSLRLIKHVGDEDQIHFEVKPFANASFPRKRESLAHFSGDSHFRGNDPIKIYVLNLADWQMNELTPDPLSSIGIAPFEPEVPLIIGKMKKGSPATTSELQLNDKILAVDGKSIRTWEQLLLSLDKKPDQELRFTIERNKKEMPVMVKLGHHRDLLFRKHGFLGISPDFLMPDYLMHKIQYGPLEASVHAFNEVTQLSYLNLLLFGKLLTHKLSLYSLGGPITIFESAGSAFQYGVLAFLGFLAFLNVALGIVNFLPIPGLDGGHLLFQVIEVIIRHPLSIHVQTFFYKLGFIFLICLIIQALTNDILRIWG